ncbi:MAG: hypothetical protein A2X86_21575 [Bdellovibrionales bacterium GWA2_49_15]|nr:MAG: hypothetical protein A2X86_21575 [Bdellovibrionales bacterium GWA2_49_15]
METSALDLSKMNNQLARTELFEICENIIRKDLEIFHIRDCMARIFGEVDFFSEAHDEFSSVNFALNLAFGKSVLELDERIVVLMEDIIVNAAFFYRRGKIQSHSDAYYALTAQKITSIIFAAAHERHPALALSKCIQLFHKNFPGLEVPFVTNLYRNFMQELKKDGHASNLMEERCLCGDGTTGGGG